MESVMMSGFHGCNRGSVLLGALGETCSTHPQVVTHQVTAEGCSPGEN